MSTGDSTQQGLGTVRIEVELEKTGDDSFPEFSYVALTEELNKNRPNGSKNDKDVQDLAAYFESKYGNFGNTAKFDKNKRKRRERIEDLMDMGEGYDCNDEFIDDSDAHDIHVPQQYDTWMGGFYVNQGKLRFKVGDESEEVNLITGTKKRNLGLKRLDDEDEDDEEKEDSENSKLDAADKLKATTQSVAQKIVAKAKKTQKVVAAPKDSTTVTKPKPVLNGITSTKSDSKLVNAAQPGPTDNVKKPTSPGRSSQRSPRSPARLIHEKQDIRVTQTITGVDENDALPAEIPTPLREKCENLRKIAELQKGLSSQKFFSPSINQMLLEIEELQVTLSVPAKVRSKLIDYLAKPMPCTRETFVVRLKKTKKESAESKITEPFNNLLNLITKLMIEQERRHKVQKENYEAKLKEYTEKSASDPSLKRPRHPAKQFSWNIEAKKCLTKLCLAKKEAYGILRPRGMTFDEWLAKYLEEDVKGAWPPGWMTSKQLEKMAKQLIEPSTQPTKTSTVAASMPATKNIAAPPLSLSKIKTEVVAANGSSNSSQKMIEKIEKVGQKRKHSDSTTLSSPPKKKNIPDITKLNESLQQQIGLILQQAMQSKGVNQAALLAEIAKSQANFSPQKSDKKSTIQPKKTIPSPTKKSKPSSSPSKPTAQTSIPDSLPPKLQLTSTLASTTTNKHILDNKQLLEAMLQQEKQSKQTKIALDMMNKMSTHPKTTQSQTKTVSAPRSTSPDLVIISSTPSTNSKTSTNKVKGEKNSGAKNNISNGQSNGNSKAYLHENQLKGHRPQMSPVNSNGQASITVQSSPVKNTIKHNTIMSNSSLQSGSSFSVQQLMSSTMPHQQQLKVTSPNVSNQQFKQHIRPSIIQSPVDCSKYTGGLNFAQIRQLNSQQTTASTPIQSAQPNQANRSQQVLQNHSTRGYQIHNNLSNDLNNIEPTLPFTNHMLTSPEQQLQHLQQLQQQQQQVNHNMNVQ